MRPSHAFEGEAPPPFSSIMARPPGTGWLIIGKNRESPVFAPIGEKRPKKMKNLRTLRENSLCAGTANKSAEQHRVGRARAGKGCDLARARQFALATFAADPARPPRAGRSVC